MRKIILSLLFTGLLAIDKVFVPRVIKTSLLGTTIDIRKEFEHKGKKYQAPAIKDPQQRGDYYVLDITDKDGKKYDMILKKHNDSYYLKLIVEAKEIQPSSQSTEAPGSDKESDLSEIELELIPEFTDMSQYTGISRASAEVGFVNKTFGDQKITFSEKIGQDLSQKETPPIKHLDAVFALLKDYPFPLDANNQFYSGINYILVPPSQTATRIGQATPFACAFVKAKSSTEKDYSTYMVIYFEKGDEKKLCIIPYKGPGQFDGDLLFQMTQDPNVVLGVIDKAVDAFKRMRREKIQVTNQGSQELTQIVQRIKMPHEDFLAALFTPPTPMASE